MYRLHRDFDLTHLTTFRVPARCAAFVEWGSVVDLCTALDSEDLPRPYLFLGGGSNMLFTAPFAGTVFHRLGQPTLDSLCQSYCESGIWGFENLSGIPGSIYGATVQNAGAYGTEMKDVIESVTLFDIADRRQFTLSNAEMRFSYRHSLLKDPENAGRLVITGLTFSTSAVGPDLGHGALRRVLEGVGEITPMTVRRAVIALRDSKLPDPAEVGSAGSFFRNPELDPDAFGAFIRKWPDAPHFHQPDGRVKIPAAWLIDNAGLKGATRGGAMVWPGQPLVIVNAEGSATAADVVELERHVQHVIAEKYNINLIPEVQHE